MNNKIQGSIFSFLSNLFSEKGIQAILAGGYAMNAYHLQRMTFDIDFIIKENDLEKIEGELFCVGYSLFNRTNAFVQYKSNSQGLRDIDFIFVDEKTMNTMLEHRRTVNFASTSFSVPAPDHLIAMKLHAVKNNPTRKPKDIPDISFLMNSGEIDPYTEKIKNIFNKYGAIDLYNNIIKDRI